MPNFVLRRSKSGPGRPKLGWTEGRKDGRPDVWKFTLVFYRTSALWGRCPALNPLSQQIIPSRARVSLTICYPWITSSSSSSLTFWAAAPKGMKSCRTQGDFRSSVCLFVHSFVRLFVRLFVCSFVHLLVCSFVCLFVPLFFRSLVCSFIHFC